jgi:hypothetical protein
LEKLGLESRFFPDVAFGPKTERPFVFGADAAFGRTRHVEENRVETVAGKTLEVQKRVGFQRNDRARALKPAIMDELIKTYLVFFERDDFPGSFQKIGDLGRFRSGGGAHVENSGSFF